MYLCTENGHSVNKMPYTLYVKSYIITLYSFCLIVVTKSRRYSAIEELPENRSFPVHE